MTEPTNAARRLGVVIVNYHRIDDCVRLAQSLFTEHGIVAEQVSIVSNGEDPETLTGARVALPAGCHVHSLPNPGYATAVNRGFTTLGRPQYLLVLTHDVTLEPRCVELLVEHLDGEPRCAVAGPLLMDSRTEGLVWSAGGTRSRGRRLPGHRFQGLDVAVVTRNVVSCAWLDGAAYLLRGAVWEEIGGLPEEYFVYMEDVDLGGRVTARGWEVHCVRSAVARQAPGDAQSVFLGVRNFLMLLTAEGARLALLLFVAETLARLGLGWLKPGQRLARFRERSSGLHHGLTDRQRPRPFTDEE
jgi:GT2 family glycosyltransferase